MTRRRPEPREANLAQSLADEPAKAASDAASKARLERQALLLTYTLMVIGFTAVTGSRIVLPLAALHSGAPMASVGLILSAFYIFPLALSWKIGVHGDRAGSRHLLMIGSACGVVAMLLPALVPRLWMLYVAAALMGFAFTCYNVLLQNVVGILSAPHDRARNFGNAAMAGALANLFGPLVAGFSIDKLGLTAAWLALAVFGIAGIVALVFFGKSLPGPTRIGSAPRRIRDTLAGEGIVRILVASSLVQAGQDLFQFYIPVYGSTIHLPASQIGLAASAYGLATFSARFAMPGLIARLGEERLLVGAFALATIGFLGIPMSSNALALSAVAVVFGLGMGCGQPVTTMMMFARSPSGRSGEALGMRQTFNNLTRVSAPVSSGVVASAIGLTPVFLISGFMMAAGGWVMRPRGSKSGAD